MEKVLIISTGGTFNKIYNPISGLLEIDEKSHAVREIFTQWLCKFKLINIIGKDSLDMTSKDRKILSDSIRQSKHKHIIIIHGTDTMDITAKYLEKNKLNKKIILTGAMVPYSINPIEATANMASAYTHIQQVKTAGIYIAMHGICDTYTKIKKNRIKGKFTLKRDYLP